MTTRRVILIRSSAVVIVLASIVTAGIFARHCFRQESYDNPELGIISYRFHFCRLREITCDANRDGIIDVTVAVTSNDDEARSTGFIVTEGWESSDFDGLMNVHYYYEEPDRRFVLELDLDKNGDFEERFVGTEAEAQLRDLRRISTVSLLASAMRSH